MRQRHITLRDQDLFWPNQRSKKCYARLRLREGWTEGQTLPGGEDSDVEVRRDANDWWCRCWSWGVVLATTSPVHSGCCQLSTSWEKRDNDCPVSLITFGQSSLCLSWSIQTAESYEEAVFPLWVAGWKTETIKLRSGRGRYKVS